MFHRFHWHREGMLRLRPSVSVPVGDRCADELVRPWCSSTLQHVRLFVRIYRDYSIADFVFVTLATLGVSYTTFSQPYVRSSVCEELSRHPELMRDMGEMGLSLENCEQWFERAVVAVLGIMFILIVVRVSLRSTLHSWVPPPLSSISAFSYRVDPWRAIVRVTICCISSFGERHARRHGWRL